MIVIIAVSGIISAEYYSSQSQFCGSCHPAEKTYDQWGKAGHGEVKCVDCHFAPGKESFLSARFSGMEHFLSFLSSSADATEVQKPSTTGNTGCTVSGCHTADKFPDGKVKLTEDFPSSHKPHEDRIIDGAILNCGTCHFDIKPDKDHVASQAACYLCLALTHVYKVAVE